ncbi:MAG: hypothetical protein A3F33_00800 [Candidatus Woykebacteria bacterium RIFCSPHIGHO2_12_FULL_43_10]|uniref:Uncharacterized protein n=2 Tax=Candidatus Woykeibacteriota TaxID=1817899 RepID=A0A1G1WYQ4_9BACT|nr:MAG: hypothetical protein A2802_01290 [Candidatus Woykebacteria bacterium RIFCSPHIGHO2_01_FULL_43_29]OGY29011.1 MAG: hypothetical protein A3F33_00800 [Candidatus Woykebacteria bacterium RIFCSPHIGHO2_12_FULL_43_10]OGY29100.1 MAG: hypothetical protein A3J50_02335 [Candidatus Woykebacteria bacterium RIFCSPHIGHO2_02_FULL_43_16b]OGY32892.1 MAG: hypothetical protein A3A61_02640 [Candidatus Woykebacteria bacterium RIFCSPLOWO2_01_FULL_43_14]
MKTLKLIWKKWKSFGRVVADFQARVLLSFFYFILLLPVGLAVRIFSDHLKIKDSSKVGWEKWDPRADTVAQSRSQG